MKPRKAVADFFGSYTHVEIDFSDLGLTLLFGKTGAGKSGLTDILLWGLWGTTSKGGAADDVLQWGSDETTKVIQEVELPDGLITVTRTRGRRSAQNDLFFVEASNPEKEIRGKDLTETQRLLSQRLGVDAELALLACLFTQFSETDRFFVSKPRDRREVLEKITDLSLPVKLAETASEARKVAKKELESLESALTKESGRQEQLLSQKNSIEKSSQAWETQNAKLIAEVQTKADGFEDEKAKKVEILVSKINEIESQILPDEEFKVKIDKIKAEQEKLAGFRVRHTKLVAKQSELKAQIDFKLREQKKQKALPDVCPECERPGANPRREENIAKLEDEINTLHVEATDVGTDISRVLKELDREKVLSRDLQVIQKAQSDNERLKDRLEAECQALVTLDESVNPYEGRLTQLKQTKNPYTKQIEAADKAIEEVTAEIAKLEREAAEKTHRVASLNSIYDLSFSLRGELLQNAVKQLERTTNENLIEYFYGVFQVAFSLDGSDKLTVQITREDYNVSYASLSGGERRQLVLSFWRALSRQVLDFVGTPISIAVMDEAFSGLDDDLKAKAFRMLEDMTNDFNTILVIDHSPSFQGLFENVIQVERVGENSVLEFGPAKEAA